MSQSQELFEIAKAHHAEHAWEAAEKAYRQAAEGHPEPWKPLNNLGVVLEAQGDPAAAMDAYQRALDLNPQMAPIWFNLGHAAQSAGEFDAAESAYLRALDLDPEMLDAAENLAGVYFDRREFAASIEVLNQCLERCHSDQARARVILNRIGIIEFQRSELFRALHAHRSALGIDPESFDDIMAIAGIFQLINDLNLAERYYRSAIAVCPESADPYRRLVHMLMDAGRRDEAEQIARDWLAAQPNHPMAKYLAGAITPAQAADRADEAVVRALFDGFAASFDETLLERLSYRAHQHVADAWRDHGPEAEAVVLDAGCGTGLCGELVKASAARLIGLDLSPDMLEKAAKRGCYDELVEQDLDHYLRTHPQSFDGILAADTLCYFGSLGETFTLIHNALVPGGTAVMTFERHDPEAPEPFVLRVSGRYQHREDYIRKALAEAALDLIMLEERILRTEHTEPVTGLLVVARLART